MPESVKKLLADLIEMYGIYGEVMCLFRQTEVHPIYILHFDALYENRILEPLEEAEALRSRLPAHFEQIKYECQEFNIRFQTEIYNNTANLRDAANLAFKGDLKLEILKSITQTSKGVEQELNRMQNSLITYAAFFGDQSRDTYSQTLNVLHQELTKPLNKELPAAAMQLVAKFLPENATWDMKDVLKFMNNRAVIVIVLRLLNYEPWKTITSFESLQKVIGNINGPNVEQCKKIFSSPAALQSIYELSCTKGQENKLFLGNREFYLRIFYIIRLNNKLNSSKLKRLLLGLINGNITFHQAITN